MSDLVLSARDLGAFANENTCHRCLWLTLKLRNLPYQTFPGIFSSIDSYNKRVVQGYFDRQGALPQWLGAFGPVRRYVPPPPYQRFSARDPDTGVVVRGTADAIFELADGTFAIADYKTARYTPSQRGLFPLYHAQLNGYAYIAARVGLSPVSQLALVYMEPVTDDGTASSPESVHDLGFVLSLSAQVVPVTLDPENLIPHLMRQARQVADLPQPPEPASGCKDCQAVHQMLSLLGT